MRLSSERRQSERLSVERPVKLRREAAGRFDVARTVNISQTGALIEVHCSRPLNPGERVALAIAPAQSAVLKAAHMIPARVVRASPSSVAVEFLAINLDSLPAGAAGAAVTTAAATPPATAAA